MSPTRTRLAGAAAVIAVAISTLGAASPALAAQTPEAAVDGLFDVVESGDLSGIDALVCEAQRDAVRELFDVGAQLGVPDGDPTADALLFEVSDRNVQVDSQDEEMATANVAATLSLSVDDDQVEDLVRAALEADLGPDDAPLSDEDVALMAPFMSSALNTSQPIDEEVSFVNEEGQWLVCGGLGAVPEPEPLGIEPEVSFDGLCGLVTIDELNTLSSLEYDSSSGFETTCTYSQSDFDAYHSATITFDEGYRLDDLKAGYGAVEEFEIAGSPAFLSGSQLFVELGDDVLGVAIWLGEDPPDDVDLAPHAIAVAERFVVVQAQILAMTAEPSPEPTSEPSPEVSLCEGLPTAELNDVSGLGLDEASGDSASCNYDSTDGDPGWNFVTAVVVEVPLDDYRLWIPGSTETTVAGQLAIASDGQLIVELPGDGRSLHIALGVDATAGAPALAGDELARYIAERLLPAITGSGTGADSASPESSAEEDDEPANAGAEAEGGLPRPMCDYVDLDAVNALGIITYDSVEAPYPEMCTLSRSEPDGGFNELTVLAEAFTIDEVRGFYPGGTDVTVAGLPGFVGESDLYVGTEAGPLAFMPVLTGSAGAEDVDTTSLTIAVAELVIAAMAAEEG